MPRVLIIMAPAGSGSPKPGCYNVIGEAAAAVNSPNPPSSSSLFLFSSIKILVLINVMAWISASPDLRYWKVLPEDLQPSPLTEPRHVYGFHKLSRLMKNY